ncbi:MAG: pseudouridine synthase [Oceanicaulis sp.]
MADENTPPDDAADGAAPGERIAKALAHSGVASRREAERLIEAGRISVNGRTLKSPAFHVHPGDDIRLDGQSIGPRPPTRVWRYHKPAGLLTTHNDPQGRETVFGQMPEDMGRVISVGRLDLNSEGLLLLTNDGELARVLELPATGWTRRYRVRAYGRADDSALKKLADGAVVDGVVYGPVEVTVDRRTGANVWLTIGLKEGKNREVRKVLSSVGLTVNRLMRTAYGPFQLGSLKRGDTEEVKLSVLRDQLGRLYPLDRDGNLMAEGAQAGPEKTGTATAKPRPMAGESGFKPKKPGSKAGWAKASPKTEPGHKARKAAKAAKAAAGETRPPRKTSSQTPGALRAGGQRTGSAKPASQTADSQKSGPRKPTSQKSGPQKTGPQKPGAPKTGSQKDRRDASKRGELTSMKDNANRRRRP